MTEPHLQPGDFLSITQLIALVPIGRSTAYALIESGELPHYRVGGTRRRAGRILIAKADLHAYLEKSRQARPVAPTRLDLDEIHTRVRNGGRPGGKAVD